MDFSSIEKQIKKISFMLETFRAQDDVISPMERELLLDYTRKLYDLFKEGEANSLPSREKNPQQNDALISSIEASTSEINTVEEQPVQKAKNVEVVYDYTAMNIPTTPIVKEVQDYKQQEINSYEESTSQLNDEILETFSPNPEPVVHFTSDHSPVTHLEESEVEGMNEVFAKKEINDLSDKLGFSPIPDLTKSMGINDRIRVVRELFGGDSELFNLTINRLNNFSSYDEAKFYLLNGVALDHGWNNEEKQKKAADFVQLVQRRFV